MTARPAVLPVRTWGPADAPALVCLHGFLGAGADWADLAARLPDVRVVAPDLPGHGAALDLPDGAYAFDGAARAVLAALDAHAIQKPALLGYSMGGRLALALALGDPGRFTRLVLESASPGLPSGAARAERRALDAARADALRADFPAFLRAWYAMPLFATLPDAARAALLEARGAGRPDALARALVGMGTGAMPDLSVRLPALAVPTVAVAGALDAKFAGAARAMAVASPNVRAVVVEGAGHNVHVEAPAAFAGAVRDALAG